MGCCGSKRDDCDADNALRAILCTDTAPDAATAAAFLKLVGKADRSPDDTNRLYMLAKEIIIGAGLESESIDREDYFRIAAALISVNRL